MNSEQETKFSLLRSKGNVRVEHLNSKRTSEVQLYIGPHLVASRLEVLSRGKVKSVTFFFFEVE